jgi:hypothetical protein
MQDQITFVIAVLCVVVGAGLFRIGLHLKSEARAAEPRKAALLIAVGIAFGFAGLLVLVLKLWPAH